MTSKNHCLKVVYPFTFKDRIQAAVDRYFQRSISTLTASIYLEHVHPDMYVEYRQSCNYTVKSFTYNNFLGYLGLAEP